jgi:hypothetical protein
MKKEAPITHKVFLIYGFVVSGYLFFVPIDKKADINKVKSLWGGFKIPQDELENVYTRLILPTDEKPKG